MFEDKYNINISFPSVADLKCSLQIEKCFRRGTCTPGWEFLPLLAFETVKVLPKFSSFYLQIFAYNHTIENSYLTRNRFPAFFQTGAKTTGAISCQV